MCIRDSNKDGSLAVNKNVTFNINGVFYIRTTDSNGVAVSYTHLYSPITVILIILLCLGPSNSIKNTDCQVPKFNLLLDIGTDSLEAVSYTHLDVYKRQDN